MPTAAEGAAPLRPRPASRALPHVFQCGTPVRLHTPALRHAEGRLWWCYETVTLKLARMRRTVRRVEVPGRLLWADVNVGDAAVGRLVEFGRELRAAGLRPGTGAVQDFCRAAGLLGVADLYWAGRATLVSRHDDIAVYDRVFAGFFANEPATSRPKQPRLRLVPAASRDEGSADADEGEPPQIARASRIELLRHKSFEQCTREELAELAQLAAGLARSLPLRRSRRRGPARAGVLDLRRTLRGSLRTNGEPFDRRFHHRRRSDRRLVLLLDVSGSMSGTSRALLVLAHALLRVHPRTEVLCFGTRVTPATRALSATRTDEALARVAETVADWEGGTRIGESLRDFLARTGHRGTARGAIVVVCSDGLDVGDPELLRAQMERLSRLAYRTIWLNPLKQDPAYEPLARGMQAALPYVDVFASGHNLASVEAVTRELVAHG
jgi:uncharacterized protein